MMQLCSKCKKRPAVVFISEMVNGKMTPRGLCLKCAKEAGIQPVNDMLEKMNITDDDIDQMNNQVMDFMSLAEENGDGDSFEPGGAATFPFLQNLFGPGAAGGEEPEGGEAAAEEKAPGRKKAKQKKRKFLDQYCTNLTARAKAGELDAIIGREAELYRTVQILCRRTKNNPCLIGEPGVGKTAIAEGLAIKIAAGDVPARLLDKEIHLLDLTGLVAGTQFRGQFESRVKGLVDEIKNEGNIILFVDEIHNMVGAGDAEGSMNAGNILKPALSRGEIQVIGATTFKEYRKYIEKDAALERRFQPVTIEEPSVEDTVRVLEGIKGYYEGYHGVTIPDGIIRRAVVLSERYINDRFLPDKAIDLMDEACACASLRNKAVDELYTVNKKIGELTTRQEELEADVEHPDYEKLAEVKSELAQYQAKADTLYGPASDNQVTEDDVAKVIELWTGIPAAKVKESDLEKLSHLEENILKRIVGQDEAVKAVAAAVRRSRVQISAHRRPASFIFVGPTGVGKTELVKVLAEQLFSTPETLLRYDMSEFMEKHSVSRLIGAPPGYVGYDEAGQLTEKVRRKPYSVILFDEIEKAHPDVLNVLLQILDDGRITDAQGRTVNFENTIIVMTSNAGSDRSGTLLGFGRTGEEAAADKSMKALEEFLRPEFIGRVDEVIPFKPLSEESMVRIAGLMLDELTGVMKEKGIAFSYTRPVCELLAKKAAGGVRGARDLRNAVRRQVEDKVVDLMVAHCNEVIGSVRLSVSEGQIKIEHTLA
ncbi:MAG TPA: ATP-dependent Clp protease ATP-binding subunit [Firmicutes bacterium]|nr:ATP-dependent Clp protease ATP-binding subunit [Bacillota bacterium]